MKMSLGDIFSDAIKYPFSDITKFLIVGVIAVLAGLSSIVMSFKVHSFSVYGIASIIGFIFSLVLAGYGVSVIRNGISLSDEIPDIDLKANLYDGVNALIIAIVYLIIPVIVFVILMAVFGVIGASIDHAVAALGLVSIVAIVLFIIFGILEVIALAKFADTNDLGESLSFREVYGDVKNIGIGKIILFLIIQFIIIAVAGIISSLIGYIPFVGIIISQLVIGAFITLFSQRALGLLFIDD